MPNASGTRTIAARHPASGWGFRTSIISTSERTNKMPATAAMLDTHLALWIDKPWKIPLRQQRQWFGKVGFELILGNQGKQEIEQAAGQKESRLLDQPV